MWHSPCGKHRSRNTWRKLPACEATIYRKLEAYATYRKLEAYATYRKLEAYATYRKLEAYATYRKLEAYATEESDSYSSVGAKRATGRPRGLTLLEMVVVLGIMAVMAVVAVKSLEPVADQSRYDATQRTLTNLEEAILGSEELRQPDGTPLITGFVADIGRVPVLRGTSAASQLAELWDESWWSSFPFALRQGPGGYSSIRLPCGYRGPYLNLGLGASDLRDGWGEAFQLQPATNGSSLQTVTWNAVAPYTDDLAVEATQGLVPVSGTVTNDGAAPGSSTVVLLYPNPSSSTTYLTVMSDGDSDERTFTFANVPIGLRAIRATIDGNTVNKYVYVPRGGLSLNINYVP